MTVTTTLLKTLIPAAALMAIGCQAKSPPPPRAGVPPVGTYTQMRPVTNKPLPPMGDPGDIAPPFDDAPLITQAPPEQGAFVRAYEGVGSPRIALFVNRTLDGRIVDTVTPPAVSGTAWTRETTTGVKMETTRERLDPWGRPIDAQTDRFETQGPGRVTDRVENYLAPGQYDAVEAARIDYDAVETIMTDWLAGGGKVTLVSPKLSESQAAALQQGQRTVLADIAKNNNIDVLIQVQAKPTRQSSEGLELRLIAEAINTQGGESIGRAVVDLPPPLAKPVINEYTRYLARKVMSDLSRSWSAPRPMPRPGESTQPPPPPAPLVPPPTVGESVPPTTNPTQGLPPAVPE